MYEISNAQDQLALLRLIMDNTWVAIQQQANAQQPPKKAKPAIKAKTPAKPVKGSYSPPPKPFPQPTASSASQKQPVNQPQTPLKKNTPQNQQGLSTSERMSSSGAPKQLPYNVLSPVNHNHSEREWQELAKQARGETPVKPL